MIWPEYQAKIDRIDRIDRMDSMDDLHVVAALFQDQPDDGYGFDDKIMRFQWRMKDPDPKSIHFEWFDIKKQRMFSSSGRGGLFSGHGLWPGVGTRFERIDRIDPEKWKLFATNITELEATLMFGEAEELIGRPYDWLGIIGQRSRFNLQFNFADYCSEVCHRIGYSCIAKRPEAERLPYMPKIRPGQMVKIYREAKIILDRINYSDIIQL